MAAVLLLIYGRNLQSIFVDDFLKKLIKMQLKVPKVIPKYLTIVRIQLLLYQF